MSKILYTLWVKRIICGLIAILALIGGIMLICSDNQALQAIGFCFFILGLTLSYIAVVQKLPNYSFWITVIALGLAYALCYPAFLSDEIQDAKQVKTSVEEVKEEEKSEENTQKKEAKKSTADEKPKKSQRSGIDFSKYPRIYGQIKVIHANVFYIGGRYVRLFGLDAPDSDQICSDANGSSYNCGQAAASWVINWIDDNEIDCYLLQINPSSVDVAVCMWGNYDIGASLVASGWGVANTDETSIYKAYEAKARSGSSGLWQGTFYSPSDWRKIKNERNNFTIHKKARKRSFFSFFKSWF